MQKAKDIVFSTLPGGEGVILNMKTKKFYTLNPTAALIYQHYENGKSIDEITEALYNEFDISVDDARTSVKEFLGELKKFELI